MSEKINWICVYKSSSRFDAEAVCGNLICQGVPAIVLNKQDSSYLAFGYIEVYVNAEQEGEALAIIHYQNLHEDGV